MRKSGAIVPEADSPGKRRRRLPSEVPVIRLGDTFDEDLAGFITELGLA